MAWECNLESILKQSCGIYLKKCYYFKNKVYEFWLNNFIFLLIYACAIIKWWWQVCVMLLFERLKKTIVLSWALKMLLQVWEHWVSGWEFGVEEPEFSTLLQPWAYVCPHRIFLTFHKGRWIFFSILNALILIKHVGKWPAHDLLLMNLPQSQGTIKVYDADVG